MNFEFNEDQNAIRDLARQIFSDQASDEKLLAFAKETDDFDSTIWNTLAEQGLLGICVPEEFGGTGLGFIELCLVLEEQGRHVAPVPLFSSVVLAGLPVTEFANAQQKQSLLPRLATGEIKLTAAVAELGMSSAVSSTVRAEKKDNTWVLNGLKTAVPDGALADFILLPVENENNTTFFILDVNTAGVVIEKQKNSFGQMSANLILNDVILDSSAILGKEGDGENILQWIERYADTALCAMQVGVCEDALRRTAEFTTERKQFGVPLGTFQAVAMRAADAYIDIEAMRSTYWQAMWRLSEGLRADAEVRAAKWWACQGSHRVVHATQHLHGGMGSDVDFPIHRYFLWAKQISFMLGNASTQITKLGQLLASDDTVGTAAIDV